MRNNRRNRASIVLGFALVALFWAAGTDAHAGWISRSSFFDVDTHGWPFENDTYEFYLLAKDTFLEISPEFAVCGGMSLSAKKRFLDGTPVEDLSESVRQELKDNQVETIGGKDLDKVDTWLWWMSRPDYPHTFEKHTIGQATKEEWPRITTSIDMGFPVVIGLVKVGPTVGGLPIGVWNIGENHQVLAIGYKYDDSSMERQIVIYDPNSPRKYVTLSMNFGLSDSQIDLRQSTGEYVRGFFVVNDAPRCMLCDYTRHLDLMPSPVPIGYRYLGSSLTQLQPKPPAALMVPLLGR